jgi:hypothetical protein
VCLSVRNSASEYGLSSETCGRLKARYDTEPLQGCDESTRAHRFAVVRVQNEALGIELALATGVCDELGGDLCRAALGDAPADDTAAPDIERQIKVQVEAPDGCREPSDVPAPDLIGTGRSMQPRRTGDVALRASDCIAGLRTR